MQQEISKFGIERGYGRILNRQMVRPVGRDQNAVAGYAHSVMNVQVTVEVTDSGQINLVGSRLIIGDRVEVGVR